MVDTVTPFLMFQGDGEEALNFYVSLFSDAKIVDIIRYGPNEQGPEGSLQRALFSLAGQKLICFDSPVKHQFDFTPSFSLFVDCSSDDELERLANALGEGGAVLMPLADYGFSRRYTWVNDRYGVSWQLNLPN